MSDPRFVAAYWCAGDKSEFGTLEQIEWKWTEANSDEMVDQLRVAQLHHDLIYRLRSALRGRHWTVAEYATEVGYSRDRMGKMMRGTAVLRLEDVVAIERLFDVPFLPRTIQRRPGGSSS